jgi:hypothetical protein
MARNHPRSAGWLASSPSDVSNALRACAWPRVSRAPTGFRLIENDADPSAWPSDLEGLGARNQSREPAAGRSSTLPLRILLPGRAECRVPAGVLFQA